ncbi:MAG: citrate transporter [Rhodospirillales bacterium]|nr:MAG: citrate transporter [Rhodospirillales bacterium]
MSGQLVVVVAVFAAVVLAIAFDLIDLAVAAMMGVVAFTVIGAVTAHDVVAAVESGGGTIALLFGGMVVARVLTPTGFFGLVGNRLLAFSGGSGRRLMLGMALLVTPLCAVLPNATVVLLLAPVVVGACRALDVDFVPPLIVLATISNASGLLTLVGDPATYLVGSAIHLSFGEYLRRVSLGGVLAILVVVALMPWLARAAWTTRRGAAPPAAPMEIKNKGFAAAALLILALMALLFVFGDRLPVSQGAPGVAILAATLALLAIYHWRIEPVEKVLSDVDWRTLIFIFCMLLMVQALVKTGALSAVTTMMHAAFGTNLPAVAIALLAGVAILSSALANTPVVMALLIVVKGYFVVIESVPEEAMGAAFDAWPAASLPVFVAMMFGATLGGNATLIGATANIVAAGISAREGRPISFGRFLRIGGPIAAAQIAVSAVYVTGLWMVTRP